MSYNMRTKNPSRKKEKENRIKEFIRVSIEVLGEGNISTIILFCSKATGEDSTWSDYDFYVITRKECGWNRKFKIYEKLPFNVDIVLRTYSEMKEGINSFNSPDIYALYYGEIIFGERVDNEKNEIDKLLSRGEIILRPELGKGVIEYGTRLRRALFL